MPHKLARRRFLLGASGAAISLPFMPSLLAGRARAQAILPKRFIFVFTSNGIRDNFWPSDDDPIPFRTVDERRHVREADLRSLPGSSISTVLGEELNPFRDKLLVLRGLDCTYGINHRPNRTLSGESGDDAPVRETLDQVLARSSTVYDREPVRRSLHVMVRGNQIKGQSVSAVKVNGEVNQIEHQDRPELAFESLFGAPIDDSQRVRRDARRLRMLDVVRAQYARLSAEPRLGREDRERLDAHLTYVHDLERRLMESAGETQCVVPGAPAALNRRDDDNLPAITRNQIDVVAAAVRCDLTRVITLQLCSGTDIRTFPWLAIERNHHDISHRATDTAVTQMGRIGNWYAAQLAYLLERLSEVEDPVSGSTYLDNSVVYWGNEFGFNPNGSHRPIGMPVVLAGSCGGFLRTGRYIDYRQLGQPVLMRTSSGGVTEVTLYGNRGRNYNELLVTLLQAMGLAPEEYEEQGTGGFGVYGTNVMNQYPDENRRAPLPYVT